MNSTRLLIIVVILNAKVESVIKRVIRVKNEKVFVNSNHTNSRKSLYRISQL